MNCHMPSQPCAAAIAPTLGLADTTFSLPSTPLLPSILLTSICAGFRLARLSAGKVYDGSHLPPQFESYTPKLYENDLFSRQAGLPVPGPKGARSKPRSKRSQAGEQEEEEGAEEAAGAGVGAVASGGSGMAAGAGGAAVPGSVQKPKGRQQKRSKPGKRKQREEEEEEEEGGSDEEETAQHAPRTKKSNSGGCGAAQRRVGWLPSLLSSLQHGMLA